MADEKEPKLYTLFTDAPTRRERIREHVMEGIEKTFPVEGKHYSLELDKFHIKNTDFSPSEQKRALMEKRTLVEPLRATVNLVDNATGKVVDSGIRTVAHVPYMTERHTFIMKGNEYSVANQVRIKPGIYTRERGNGEFEAAFNLAKGKNFRLSMDPEKGIFHMEYDTSKVMLHPVLVALGLPKSQIDAAWGAKLAKLNEDHARGKEDREIQKLYLKAVPAHQQKKGLTAKEMADQIKATYAQTVMDPGVNALTLGQQYDKVNAPALLRASQKLVNVFNEKEVPDDRDSLAFKTLHTVESFMKERIEKEAVREVQSKSVRKLNQKSRDPQLDDYLPASAFTKSLHKFMTSSALASTPMQINPVEMFDSAAKVTALGEGGISSTLAVPDEARDVHASHMGMLDPVRTPESSKAGIDVRGSMHLARDDKGNMYTPVHNPKTGKAEYIPADKLVQSTVAFYGQDIKGKKNVDVMKDGVVRSVSAKEVDYQIPYAASMYSPSTNLVPMLNNAMGNRNIMGSKFQTQAVPLVDREVPFVQVESWRKDRSVEREFGSMISPVAPVSGTVEKVDKDYVYIRPDQTKKASLMPENAPPHVPNHALIIQCDDILAQNNTRAESFYSRLQSYLETQGYTVRLLGAGDPGPLPPASLVIGHVQGARRLKDAPVGAKILAFNAPVAGAINHPQVAEWFQINTDGKPQGLRLVPDEIFVFSKAMKQAIDGSTQELRAVKTASFGGQNVFYKYASDGSVVSKFDTWTGKTYLIKTAASGVKREIEQEELVKVPYSTYFPMMSKTYLHDEINVTKGQRVTKGESLGENNFTRGDTLALGKNLSVAYMPYYGMNSNDAIVVSEGAAKKMTSTHMYTESVTINKQTILDREKHKANFGTKYDRSQYEKLDERGVIKVGQTVEPGELLIAVLRDNSTQGEDQMLGKLHKSLLKPYRDGSVTWTQEFPGTVTDVSVTGSNVTVAVRTSTPAQIGDKIANRNGGKGVIAKIVPDEQMIQDANGKPIDVLLTSAGIITRTNPNQIIETAVGKVVAKTGVPIAVPQDDGLDRVQWAKDLLKEHKIKDKETVFDPISGKHIPDVFVGNQYTFKMFKSTDTNYAGRGVGPGYDVNLQPTRGGESGAKSIGKMEFNALIAHDARAILNEAANIKSEKNDEYWRRLQLGLPPPAPSENFAFGKFQDMLIGSGINVKKDGNEFALAPLTDKDIDQMATGTVKNPLLVKTKTTSGGANIVAEKGGLFDPAVTGGMQGTRYAKIELAEPVINPIFEEPVQRLLGLTKREMISLRDEKGAAHIKSELNKLDLEAKQEELREVLKTSRGSTRNDALKQMKYIQALDKEGLKPGDAYILTKVPVTPPVVRPIMPNPDGTTLVADANYLYRDILLANQSITELNPELKTEQSEKENRKHIHAAVGALFGTNDPVSTQNAARGVKGHLQQITGTGSPKDGYFQDRLMKRRQDLSGRATIAPDHTLGIDEVGLPEDMAWDMYEPFVVKELVRKGFTAVQARDKVKNRDPAARAALEMETKDRPVLFNRAPTLHRFNMISAFPKLIPGKTLRLNPFAESGMNADYDGDALQIHTPVSAAAVQEAKGMTLSNLVFSDRSKDALMVFPAHEAIIGTYLATKDVDKGPVQKFKTTADAMAAYTRGDIKMSTPVEIGNKK